MKVRIGYGFGVRTTLNDDGFGVVVDALERLRFDSLWLSERIEVMHLTLWWRCRSRQVAPSASSSA